MTILLVDLGATFWATWHASGSQVAAYEHTIDTVLRYRWDYERTIVCADSPRNWRSSLTTELPKEQQYKANRPKKPEPAVIALQDVKERLRRNGVPVVECDNYEADDVIATLCTQAFAYPVAVLSDDKDLYQLIDESTVLLTKSGVRDIEGCRQKFGVAPSQIRDLLALWGDAADNITGCPGVGQGKAAALLEVFGSIEGIKAAGPVKLGQVKGIGKTIVSALTEWDPALAVQLVTLATDAPVSLREQLRAIENAA